VPEAPATGATPWQTISQGAGMFKSIAVPVDWVPAGSVTITGKRLVMKYVGFSYPSAVSVAPGMRTPYSSSKRASRAASPGWIEVGGIVIRGRRSTSTVAAIGDSITTISLGSRL